MCWIFEGSGCIGVVLFCYEIYWCFDYVGYVGLFVMFGDCFECCVDVEYGLFCCVLVGGCEYVVVF